MIIKESDFELRSSTNDESCPHWDLYIMKTINAKSKTREAREELTLAGYGLTLSGAMASIARYRVAKANSEKAFTMQQYLDSYTKFLKNYYVKIELNSGNHEQIMQEILNKISEFKDLPV